MTERQTPIQNIPGYKITERGPEIFGPSDGPLELPVEKIGSGPLYMDADERLDNLRQETAEGSDVALPFSFKTDFNSLFTVGRRDVLKMFSVSAAAAAASCVRRPLEKAVPYVNQPVDQAVGVPTYFASTCGECPAACGVMVKTSSGLPIKIEGNPESPLNQGGTCATGQATLQGLFHPERRQKPTIKVATSFVDSSWEDVYTSLSEKISGKKIAIFTGGSTGHQKDFYTQVLKKLGGEASDLYTYEANGLYAAMSQAHNMAFGFECLPRFESKGVKNIVGIGSDFLDIGISPVFYAKSFSNLKNDLAQNVVKFTQFESYLSKTGAKADTRYSVPVGSEILIALSVLKSLVNSGTTKGAGSTLNQAKKVLENNRSILEADFTKLGVSTEVFDQLAQSLLTNNSVVFSGSSASDEWSTQVQLVTILINDLIGAYNQSLIVNKGWMPSPVRAEDLPRFLKNHAKYEAVFFVETNPVFSLPQSMNFAEILKKIPVVVSMQSLPNEMDDFAQFQLNTNHYLESWGDEQPIAGYWSPRQPAVRTVTESMQAEDVFIWIAATLNKPMGFKDYFSYLKTEWKKIQQVLEPKVEEELFFNSVLRRGFIANLATKSSVSISANAFDIKVQTRIGGLKITSPMDSRLRDGRGANKPLLQEIGDSMTSIAWDSWISLNPETAKKLSLKRNELITVKTATGSFEAALYPQPGLHAETVMIYRGNGHAGDHSLISKNTGVNPLIAIPAVLDSLSGQPAYSNVAVELAGTNRRYVLAAMQKSGDLGNRVDIVKKVSSEEVKELGLRKKSLDDTPNLYPALDVGIPYRWGMSVDLNKCTGCGACMAACAVENNVPQVGREEVLKHRHMHWIRLDRYYEGSLDNPTVSFQPMMCQQCTHAPCEAVCPVIATSHDPEGINTMTYNRCIGTRYCANACPYKVRRFNWWTHKWGVIGERAVDRNPRALNPDVTVRTRGVMEKCNFCAHRVRHAKFEAKVHGQTIRDGEVKVACEQVCPSNAIVFGNLKDPESRVAKLRAQERSYLALGGEPEKGEYGLKTLPNVSYMMQVTEHSPKKNAEHEHG